MDQPVEPLEFVFISENESSNGGSVYIPIDSGDIAAPASQYATEHTSSRSVKFVNEGVCIDGSGVEGMKMPQDRCLTCADATGYPNQMHWVKGLCRDRRRALRQSPMSE